MGKVATKAIKGAKQIAKKAVVRAVKKKKNDT